MAYFYLNNHTFSVTNWAVISSKREESLNVRKEREKIPSVSLLAERGAGSGSRGVRQEIERACTNMQCVNWRESVDSWFGVSRNSGKENL